MFRRLTVPTDQVFGEAADDRIRQALEARGCIITECGMIPMAHNQGWMHFVNFRRPRLFSRWFGYGPEMHMSVSAHVIHAQDRSPITVGAVPQARHRKRILGARYEVGMARADRTPGYRHRVYHGLAQLLRSL